MEKAHGKTEPLHPESVWRTSTCATLPPPGSAIRDRGLAIDAPLRLADADAHNWAGEADMIVVGLSGGRVVRSA